MKCRSWKVCEVRIQPSVGVKGRTALDILEDIWWQLDRQSPVTERNSQIGGKSRIESGILSQLQADLLQGREASNRPKRISRIKPRSAHSLYGTPYGLIWKIDLRKNGIQSFELWQQ